MLVGVGGTRELKAQLPKKPNGNLVLMGKER